MNTIKFETFVKCTQIVYTHRPAEHCNPVYSVLRREPVGVVSILDECCEKITDLFKNVQVVMHGVMVSMSAFLACHECHCAGLSLGWGLNLRASVCGIFYSSSPGVFSGYSSFFPSFIG